MLALPLAQADWGGRGFWEPDTDLDRTGAFVWENPDTDPNPAVRQVYFTAFTTHFAAGVNPNLATTGGAVMPYPTSNHALLGVWKDCNNDGYIGMIESALFEYRSELLLENKICPPTDVDPDAADFEPVHNDGQWVQEFLWIGPDHPELCEDGVSLPVTEDNDTNPYNFHDGCARVWGDFGLPGAAAGNSCPINPRPRGTYQSVGGFLRYADCLNGWRVTGAINTVAYAAGQPHLAFSDAPQDRPDQSESPLNVKNPYGQPSGDPAVSVFDCSGEHTEADDPTGGDMRRIRVDDPTGLVPDGVTDPTGRTGGDDDTHATKNEDGSLVAVNGTGDDGRVLALHNVKVPSVDGNGHIGGSVNETLEGLPYLGFDGVYTGAGNVTYDGPDCDRSEGFGWNSDIYDALEDDFEATGAKRVQTDFYHGFFEGTRGNKADPLGPATSPTLGQGVHRDVKGLFIVDAPYWFGAPGYVGSRNPYINRETLEPWGVVSVTTYATVSASAIGEYGLSLSKGDALSVYGSEHCDGLNEITGAFQCDPSLWYLGPKGESIRTAWQVTVGQSYNLRDVDCYDTTVAAGTPSVPGTVANKACQR